MLSSLLNREQREQLRRVGSLSTVGLELGLSIAIGYLGGRWLDEKLGTGPWLEWIGLGFGLAAAAQSLYRAVRRAQRLMEEEDESQ